jgi:hypothetical protein
MNGVAASALRPGDRVRLVSPASAPDRKPVERFGVGTSRSGPGKAVIEITFSSIYGDRWKSSSDAIVPEKL